MRGMYRVAKPRGKVAAIVFSVVEKNPYEGVPFTVAHRWGSIMPPLFVLSDTGVLEKNFRDGGFPDVAVHTVSMQRHFPPNTEIIRRLEGSESGRNIDKLPDAEREQAWAEVEQQMRRFEGRNGCEVPGELLIGVGTK